MGGCEGAGRVIVDLTLLLKMEIFPVMGPSSVTPARQNKSPPHHKCMHIPNGLSGGKNLSDSGDSPCAWPPRRWWLSLAALARLGAAHDHVRASEPARLLPDSLRLQ